MGRAGIRCRSASRRVPRRNRGNAHDRGHDLQLERGRRRLANLRSQAHARPAPARRRSQRRHKTPESRVARDRKAQLNWRENETSAPAYCISLCQGGHGHDDAAAAGRRWLPGVGDFENDMDRCAFVTSWSHSRGVLGLAVRDVQRTRIGQARRYGHRVALTRIIPYPLVAATHDRTRKRSINLAPAIAGSRKLSIHTAGSRI